MGNELKTSMVIPDCRLTFVYVNKPYRNEDGKEKYTVQILIPFSEKQLLKDVMKCINNAKEKDKATRLKGKEAKKIPLRNGNKERPDIAEYKNHYFLTANSDYQPTVLGPDKEPITDARKLYSGCYGHVSVNFYGYSNKSTGIACGLNNIMKTRDGEPLGGGRTSATKDFEEFEAIEEEEDFNIDDEDSDLLG
jgi:hypothetical protein